MGRLIKSGNMKLGLILFGISNGCSKNYPCPEGFECGGHEIPGGLACDAPNRIVGGQKSKAGNWPWIAKLGVEIDFNVYVCGGTIIDDEWILTAAHCLVGNVTAPTIVEIGNLKGNKQNEPGEFELEALEYFIHPDYQKNSETEYDFALIKIPSLSANKPDDCDECYDQACLPTDHVAAGRHCYIAGWGMTSTNMFGRLPNVMKEAGIDVFSNEYCVENSYLEEKDLNKAVEFCAGTPDKNGNSLTEKGTDACQGDSGGPLICVDNNRPVLYGVTSWGIGCGDKGYPGVFAKVSAVLNWISSTANI